MSVHDHQRCLMKFLSGRFRKLPDKLLTGFAVHVLDVVRLELQRIAGLCSIDGQRGSRIAQRFRMTPAFCNDLSSVAVRT